MRNEEQQVDISIFEGLNDLQAYEYLKWKYCEEVANEIKKIFEKITIIPWDLNQHIN